MVDTMTAEPDEIVEEAYENQRFLPVEGFHSNYLLPGERQRWSDEKGAPVAVSCVVSNFVHRMLQYELCNKQSVT